MDVKTKTAIGSTGLLTCWRAWEYYQSIPLDGLQQIAGHKMSPFFVQDIYLGLVFLGLIGMLVISSPWWGERLKFKRTKLYELREEMAELLKLVDFDAAFSDTQAEIKKRSLMPKLKSIGVQCPSLSAADSTWRNFLIVLIPYAENRNYRAASEISLPGGRA